MREIGVFVSQSRLTPWGTAYSSVLEAETMERKKPNQKIHLRSAPDLSITVSNTMMAASDEPRCRGVACSRSWRTLRCRLNRATGVTHSVQLSGDSNPLMRASGVAPAVQCFHEPEWSLFGLERPLLSGEWLAFCSCAKFSPAG